MENGVRPRLCMARDEVADARVDQLAVLAAAEDAVVAHALRLEMLLVARRDAAHQTVRGLGLPVARDVVELALDGEERCSLDELRPHRRAADHQLAARQEMALEHAIDGLEVV